MTTMTTLLEHYTTIRAAAVEMMHRLDAEAKECIDPTTGVILATPSEWRRTGTTPPVTDRTYVVVSGRGSRDGGLFLAKRHIGDDRVGGIQFRVLRVPTPWDGRDMLVRVVRTQLRSVLAEYVCPADDPAVAEIKAEAERTTAERMRLHRAVTERRALLQQAFGPPTTGSDYDALGRMLERVEQTAAQLGPWASTTLDEIRSGESPEYFEAEAEAWQTAEADLWSSLRTLVSTAPADRSTVDAAHKAARRLRNVVRTLARAEA